jgi:hypothetical protein
MGSVATFLYALTIQHWLTIAAIVVGIFFGTFGALNYLAGRRERKLRTYESTPEVKAVINRKRYEGGWRSVQLHISPPAEKQNFDYKNWHITRARLLRPVRGVVLARAEGDDYAKGVFYPENPIRALVGKAEGRPQRFALEFFIHFKQEDDKGSAAKFKVAFSHASKRRHYTAKTWAAVPANAE